jgi:hypothetical protein
MGDYIFNITTKNDRLVLKYKKNNKLCIGGNIFINYFIILLRNPLLDFSYVNTKDLHYDTLDKF